MLTIHDQERTPVDRLTCSWGFLANLGSTVASGAQAAGTTAANAATTAGSSLAQGSGLSSLYNAGSSLLQGGGEAGYLQSLGQQVPQGVELAGPMGQGGFWDGFTRGFSGVVGGEQGPSVGNQFGQGLGMLGNFIDNRGGVGQMNAGSLLRSALAQYTGMDRGGMRPYSGGPPPQQQGGLLSFHLGGSTGL